MKKAAITLVAITLVLTGCTSAPEATNGKSIVRTVTDTADVANTLITKELAKNLPETVDKIAGVAETLIENAVKEGQ